MKILMKITTTVRSWTLLLHRKFLMNIKTTVRSGIIVITQENIVREISGKYSSNYDYYFIIKDLAEEFEGQFECLGENT